MNGWPMTHVLTLISPRQERSLDDGQIEKALACLPSPGVPRWLSEGEACDITFTPDTDGDVAVLENTLRTGFGSLGIDVAIQPAGNRRKKLLVADMDSTIIRQECIDEIADFAGLKDRISAITEQAMRGELNFEAALRERVGLLAGLDEKVLQRVFDERIEMMPGARTLVQTMCTNGAYCALVSGGFTFFTSRIAAKAGFHTDQANRLCIADGKLSGSVEEPILGQDAKLEALMHFRDEQKLTPADTIAVGDGANDLRMIKEAGLGVAYHAKPIVAKEAHVRIDHCDLTALLYVQGYAWSEFRT